MIGGKIDSKTVGFLLKISKEIGKVWGERKKTTVCFPYNKFVPTRGVQNCRRAVKNLITTPPSKRTVIDFEEE